MPKKILRYERDYFAYPHLATILFSNYGIMNTENGKLSLMLYTILIVLMNHEFATKNHSYCLTQPYNTYYMQGYNYT